MTAKAEREAAALRVPCPLWGCRARAGEPCTRTTGLYTRTTRQLAHPHDSRIEAAATSAPRAGKE